MNFATGRWCRKAASFCSPQQRRCKRTTLVAAPQFVAGGCPFCVFLRARNRDRWSVPKQGPLIHKCTVRSRNRDRFPVTKQGPKRVPKRIPTLEPAISFGWHAWAAIARSSAVGELVAGSALNSYVARPREHWNLQASPKDPLPGRLSKPRTPNDFM